MEWLESRSEESGEESSVIGGFAELGSLFLNPPVLIIAMLGLVTRYRYQTMHTRALEQELEAKTRHWDREKEYLESHVQEMAAKSARSEGDLASGLRTNQQSKNAHGWRVANKNLDDIVIGMSSVSVPRGVDVISVSQLQQLVEITSTLEQHPAGGAKTDDDQRSSRVMYELLAKSTIVIANVGMEYAGTPRQIEQYVTKKLQVDGSCMVLACTVYQFDDDDSDSEDELDSPRPGSPRSPGSPRLGESGSSDWMTGASVALVTFSQPVGAQAKVSKYDTEPNRHQVGASADETDWFALMWEQVRDERRFERVFGIIGQTQENGAADIRKANSRDEEYDEEEEVDPMVQFLLSPDEAKEASQAAGCPLVTYRDLIDALEEVEDRVLELRASNAEARQGGDDDGETRALFDTEFKAEQDKLDTLRAQELATFDRMKVVNCPLMAEHNVKIHQQLEGILNMRKASQQRGVNDDGELMFGETGEVGHRYVTNEMVESMREVAELKLSLNVVSGNQRSSNLNNIKVGSVRVQSSSRNLSGK